MEKYKFENYLQEKHAEQYTGVDDDMSDNYDVWISNLDGQELINYADIFALKLSGMHIDDLGKRIKNAN